MSIKSDPPFHIVGNCGDFIFLGCFLAIFLVKK